jgi:hypothetical protein
MEDIHVKLCRNTSRALELEWEKIAADEPAVHSIDCTADVGFCKEIGVTAFPAIRLYLQDGSVRRYRGPRKAREYVIIPDHRPRIAVIMLTNSILE